VELVLLPGTSTDSVSLPSPACTPVIVSDTAPPSFSSASAQLTTPTTYHSCSQSTTHHAESPSAEPSITVSSIAVSEVLQPAQEAVTNQELAQQTANETCTLPVSTLITTVPLDESDVLSSKLERTTLGAAVLDELVNGVSGTTMLAINPVQQEHTKVAQLPEHAQTAALPTTMQELLASVSQTTSETLTPSSSSTCSSLFSVGLVEPEKPIDNAQSSESGQVDAVSAVIEVLVNNVAELQHGASQATSLDVEGGTETAVSRPCSDHSVTDDPEFKLVTATSAGGTVNCRDSGGLVGVEELAVVANELSGPPCRRSDGTEEIPGSAACESTQVEFSASSLSSPAAPASDFCYSGTWQN
jgi:hypothetical protein